MVKIDMYAMLDKALIRYNLPLWVKPYIIEYIKSNPINAIKRGMSFVDVKRKKGSLSANYVELPNGTRFKMSFIADILNQFYYGEKLISGIYKEWSDDHTNYDKIYSDGFKKLSVLSKKHARAIKNLIDGMEMNDIGPNKGTLKLVEFIKQIDKLDERILVSGLILKYTYAQTFGMVFYKVFYPTAPEFMRSFGKALSVDNKTMQWLDSEVKNIIKNNDDVNNTIEFIRKTLMFAVECIDTELPSAKQSGIEKEFLLLRNIAIAYPFYIIKEQGCTIDPDTETKLLFNSIKDNQNL